MKNPNCPKCGHIMDTYADDYWCSYCHLKYTKADVALKSGELSDMEKAEAGRVERIESLEGKFKLLGGIMIIIGILQFFVFSPLTIVTGILSIGLGIFLFK